MTLSKSMPETTAGAVFATLLVYTASKDEVIEDVVGEYPIVGANCKHKISLSLSFCSSSLS